MAPGPDFKAFPVIVLIMKHNMYDCGQWANEDSLPKDLGEKCFSLRKRNTWEEIVPFPLLDRMCSSVTSGLFCYLVSLKTADPRMR